jgi:hypothetical protein
MAMSLHASNRGLQAALLRLPRGVDAEDDIIRSIDYAFLRHLPLTMPRDQEMNDSKPKHTLHTHGYNDGSLLRYYRAVNEAHRDCVAYVLGDRGFFAEVTTVARAMIYAWVQRRQLVLDCGEFAYRFRDGWADYFQPFCKSVSDVLPEQIHERFRFTRSGDRSLFQKLRAFDPGRIRFGTVEIEGMQPLIRHFMRLIFRLSYDSQRQLSLLRESLQLPRGYVAIHVRRGDKVGDEDMQYPVERYLEELGQLQNETIFVMSDDHGAVGEVRDYLRLRDRGNRVATLCRQEHTGFDIWKLRAAERFAGGNRLFEGQEEYRRYVWEETNRLLAETVIATHAMRFASTFGSNVGKTVWYLHDDPDACRLIRR